MRTWRRWGAKRALAGLADGLEDSRALGPLVHSGSIWPRRLDTQDLCSNLQRVHGFAIVLVSGSSDLRTVVAFDQKCG